MWIVVGRELQVLTIRPWSQSDSFNYSTLSEAVVQIEQYDIKLKSWEKPSDLHKRTSAGAPF